MNDKETILSRCRNYGEVLQLYTERLVVEHNIKIKIQDSNTAEVFPAVNTIAVEFDTYLEAKAYVVEHGLVYEKSKYGE